MGIVVKWLLARPISKSIKCAGLSIETLFLIAQPEYSHISSTIVREIIIGGADAGPFVPEEIRVSLGAVKI